MSHSNLARLRGIKTLPQLAAYLRDELDWPIESDDTDAITFDYSPGELGLDEKSAVNIREIKQLRPLAGNQPWGIFFVNFEKKRLPVVAMRRILRALVFKKRASANKAERQAWHPHDLLFISAYGEESDRAITFAHFVDRPDMALAELRVLGWDDDDTPLHADYVVQMLQEKLRWDSKVAANPKLWRDQWASAFLIRHGHVIRTSEELAEELAVLARRLRGRIRTILRMEAGDGQIRTLQRAFQIGLIHDLDDDGFADMFAQTVTYGLFSVSVRRTFPGIGTAVTKDDVPNLIFTSPFLKDMLGVFLGIKSYKGKIDFDELGVSDVTDLLTSPDTHMEVVLADFNNKTRGEDPVIHFYEHFLTAYNKELKVQRGVFYTPQPVVSYIVRSVHELLQTEFGLADGLADTTTWGEMIKRNPSLQLPPLTDELKETLTLKPSEIPTISPEEPFVQILDPATGTATFLVEVIDVIHRTLAAKWQQQRLTTAQQLTAWNDYVPKHLLPRLHAYELMMAPYAIAHMKIGLKLAETGYRFATEERARIYLTNALEPKVKQLPQIGFDALAQEAAAVNEIKWHKRFTVVIGNPPYSNFGQLNRTEFLLGLLEDYKRGLNEKKLNLDDDFIKFVRFGQHVIQQSGTGVLGLITNNVFLDGLTHRRMRQSLRESFSGIRLLDLHGSARKLETGRAGGEENVFEIQQGVAVGLFTRPIGIPHSSLFHADMWGTREVKYSELDKASVESTSWSAIESRTPNFFFVPKSNEGESDYQSYWKLDAVFMEAGKGVQTERDRVSIHFSKQEIEQAVDDFRTQPASYLKEKYELTYDSRDWTIAGAVADVKEHKNPALFREILYRPFDIRYTWYSGQTRGFIGTPGKATMKHFLAGQNIGLSCLRQTRRGEVGTFFVGRQLMGKDLVSIFDRMTVFPLYLYDESLSFDFESRAAATSASNHRRPNLSRAFLTSLGSCLKLQIETSGLPAGVTPEGIFHYAYAIFHSPSYRRLYAEFLKIEFPRIPLAANFNMFCALARLGGELTTLQLLESPKLEKPITDFIGGRAPTVEKITWTKNTVWIDKAQTTGFKGVKEEVWNFHIGGYQVCEKWLKDRKDRKLLKEDVEHYQKTIVAISETIRLMAEIDRVIAAHGGWPGAFAVAASAAPPATETLPAVPDAAPTDLGLHTEDELPLG